MSEPGSPPRGGWNLKHLMIAIAMLAAGLGTLGVSGTLVLVAMIAPVGLAPPGERIARLYWVGAFYPSFLAALLFLEDSELKLTPGSDLPPLVHLLIMTLLFATPLVFVAMWFGTLIRVSDHSRVEWYWIAQIYEILLVPPLWFFSSWLLMFAYGSS